MSLSELYSNLGWLLLSEADCVSSCTLYRGEEVSKRVLKHKVKAGRTKIIHNGSHTVSTCDIQYECMNKCEKPSGRCSQSVTF